MKKFLFLIFLLLLIFTGTAQQNKVITGPNIQDTWREWMFK